MVQALFRNPDALASNLGGVTRVKGSSWDTELNFEKMNMTYKFKYKDSSNKLKVSSRYIYCFTQTAITIKNLSLMACRRFFPERLSCVIAICQ